MAGEGHWKAGPADVARNSCERVGILHTRRIFSPSARGVPDVVRQGLSSGRSRTTPLLRLSATTGDVHLSYNNIVLARFPCQKHQITTQEWPSLTTLYCEINTEPSKACVSFARIGTRSGRTTKSRVARRS
eukprot:2827700-Rhodomonas_salina.2